MDPPAEAPNEPAIEAPAPVSGPVPVIDRLRTDELTHLSVVRGGTLIAAAEGARRLQIFDGSRGRLLAERVALDEVLCASTPVLPGGLRSLWLRAPRTPSGPVRLALRDHAGDRDVFEAEAAPGRSVQCAGAIDGTRAVVVSSQAARIIAVPSGTVEDEIPLALVLTPSSRVERVATDERGAAFVAVLSGVPAAQGDAVETVVVAWGGEGGRRVRRLTGVLDPSSVVLSSSGNLVASSGADGAVVVHSTWTGKEVARVPGERAVGFVTGDASLFVRDPGGGIIRWQLEELRREASVEAWPGVGLAAVSEDGLRVALAGTFVAADGPAARLSLFGPEGDARFDRSTALFPVEGLALDEQHLALLGPKGRRRFERRTGDALEPEASALWLQGIDVSTASGPGGLALAHGRAVVTQGSQLQLLSEDAGTGHLTHRATVTLDDAAEPVADAAWVGDEVWVVAGGLHRGTVASGHLLRAPPPDDAVAPAGADGQAVAGPAVLDPRAVIRVAARAAAGQDRVVTLLRPAPGEAWVCDGLRRASCVDVSGLGAWGDDVLTPGWGTALAAGGDTVALLSAARLALIRAGTVTCEVRVGHAVAAAVAPDAGRVAITDGREAQLYDARCQPVARIVPLPIGGVALSADGLRGRAGHAGGALRFRRGTELVASDAELAPLVAAFDPGPLAL